MSCLPGCQLAANPDTALQSLVRLIEKHPDLRKLAAADTETSEPLYRVLGASEALGEFLIRHPEHLDAFDVPVSPEPLPADAAELRARLLRSVRADPKAARPVAGSPGRRPTRPCAPPTGAGWWTSPSRTCAPPIRWTSCPPWVRNWRISPERRSRRPSPFPGPKRRRSSTPRRSPTSDWP